MTRSKSATRAAPRRREILLAGLAVLGLGPIALAESNQFQLFSSTAVLDASTEVAAAQLGLGQCCAERIGGKKPDDAYDLDLRFPAHSTTPTIELPSPTHLSPQPKVFWITTISVMAIAGSAYNSFGDGPNQKYHFTNEGWFGQNTYAGGGDKASHIASFYSVARLLTSVYGALDAPSPQSYQLGSIVSAAAGLTTELGDGSTKYGFSYEDLIMDTAGAGAAYFFTRYQLNDLMGFRAGIVPAPEIPPCCIVNGLGKDYSAEIYTFDLKFAGLAKRLDRRFGLARFLLAGATYSAKGYPDAQPQYQERQLGFEVGLNLAEIARAAGVPEDRWWGNILITILDFVRLPYTAVVFPYDLNHNQWKKPTTGGTNAFPYQ
ncbi:MAG TPA: DUF2279 domain-containing protein [Thermoanaerobaculia bacterium]|nr:DUF2279 domain-containing protein [Thermoanaerobaculia bacterium]